MLNLKKLPLQLQQNISADYLPWIVCFTAALFFFYEFIQMHMFNAISVALIQTFHLNAAQLGNLSATYLYADVIFLLPAGILLDRFSTRLIILIAVSICIAGTLLFALAQHVWVAAVAHFLAGIGNGFCFLSCIRLASRWFPPQRMALVTGLIVTFAMAGGIVAQTPLTILSAAVGWRAALLFNGCLGLLIWIAIWLFVQDCPPQYQATQQQYKLQLKQLGFWQSLWRAIANKQNWYCGIYTSLLNLPIMLLCALWGNLYLTQVHHISALQASYAITLIFIGTIIGCPLIGWLSDQWGYRKPPVILGTCLALVTVLALLFSAQLSYIQILVIFFMLGLFTSAQVLGYPSVTENNPPILTSTAMGLASVLIMGGGAFAQPLFGLIMDWQTHGNLASGHLYAPYAYQYAMLILPIAFFIALLMAALSRETRCQRLSE